MTTYIAMTLFEYYDVTFLIPLDKAQMTSWRNYFTQINDVPQV